ncbi:uncharacterized protein [Rutidosis leptorrhynchoides]|uniref:uncharacterized protein n=1 Tax=Rutidosis leptorrhynchoides TaxID=125765 RepID=UPI003A9A12AB
MEESAQMNDNVDLANKKRIRSKKDGAKIRRKINKAEREKLKRDHMNELFLDLTNALEPATHNIGKSSVLTDTIRILQDLMAQVESLKKENSALLAESQYVAVETNELKEETSALESQIKKLQSQIEERAHSQSNPFIGPVFVVPINSDPNLPEIVTKQVGPNVSKPHARYPSPSDSWPLNILSEQPRSD